MEDFFLQRGKKLSLKNIESVTVENIHDTDSQVNITCKHKNEIFSILLDVFANTKNSYCAPQDYIIKEIDLPREHYLDKTKNPPDVQVHFS